MHSIILVNDFKRYQNILATRLIRSIREHVGRCENCGSVEDLTCHHTIKRASGGSDYGDNLVVLCVGCHEALHEINEGTYWKRSKLENT